MAPEARASLFLKSLAFFSDHFEELQTVLSGPILEK